VMELNNVVGGGSRVLSFRYSWEGNVKPFEVFVNGVSQGAPRKPQPTGRRGVLASDIWNVTLPAGNNTVRLVVNKTGGLNSQPMIDKMDVHNFGSGGGLPPASPPGSVAASDDTYTNRVAVSWGSVSGATYYEVYRSTSMGSNGSLRSSPAGTSYDDTSATPGTYYYYSVRACNSSGCSGFSSQDVGRRAVSGNQPPVLTSIGSQTVLEGQLLTVPVSASDPDGGPSPMALSETNNLPGNPSIITDFGNGLGELNWTPAAGDAAGSPYSVTVTVTDGAASVNRTFSISVNQPAINTPPVITSTPVLNGTEDIAYSYTFTATDVDVGDTLTYSAPVLPSWLNFNAESGVLSGTPTNADVGSHNVTLRVRDGQVNVNQPFTIIISNANDAPVITSVPTATGIEDTAYSYTFTATDVDAGDTLTYSALILPGWLNFNAATGVLSGTPANADVGSHDVTLRVSDGNISVDQVFSILVSNANDMPVITSMPITTGTESTAYSYTFTATDVDIGNMLTYSAPILPGWLNFNAATGVLSGTPATADVGSHNVTLRVSDGQANVDQAFVILISGSANVTPIITSTPITIGAESTAYSYTFTATDTDAGDTLTFSAPVLPGWLSFDAVTGVLSGTPANADVGSHNVTLSVSDGQVNTTQAFTIVISSVNSMPPVLTLPPDLTVDASGLLTLVDLNASPATAVDSQGNSLSVTHDAPAGFSPGANEVTWRAVDALGIQVSAVQQVNVRPQATIAASLYAGEGATVTAEVMLNGEAPVYPVTIPYTVSGTASNPDDHDLANGTITINSGRSGAVSFSVVDDGVNGEPNETVIINLGASTNAVSGLQNEMTITIVEDNLPPLPNLEALQNGMTTRDISINGGAVTLTVTANDPNPLDTHSFDWSLTDNNLVDTDGDLTDGTFIFDPANLSAGVYTIDITVADDGTPAQSTVVRLDIRVLANLPVLSSQNDSDNDGIDDASEGAGDTDNDGIPDYLDASNASNIIQTDVGSANPNLLETEPGLTIRLGSTAFAASNGGAGVSQSDIDNFGQSSGDTADTVTNIGGIFDFEIVGLPQLGQSVTIVLPQLAPIPQDPVYRKLTSAGWVDFAVDANNILASASGQQGICPPPGDSAYISGLVPGDWCVQLTIEDGGSNDADGIANGVISDPGGVADQSGGSAPAPGAGSSGGSSGGSGGCSLSSAPEKATVDLLLPLMILVSLIYLGKKRRSEMSAR